MLIRMVVSVALLAGAAAADVGPLDGRTIVLEAHDQQSVDVPVSLPYSGAIGDGEVIRVVEPKTGKEFPGTLRDGHSLLCPKHNRRPNTCTR